MMLEAKAIIAGIALVLLFLGYQWVGHRAVEQYKTEQAVAQAKVNKAKQDIYDKLSADYEALKIAKSEKARTRTKVVEKIVEREVYKNVCIDQEGLEELNKALKGE